MFKSRFNCAFALANPLHVHLASVQSRFVTQPNVKNARPDRSPCPTAPVRRVTIASSHQHEHQPNDTNAVVAEVSRRDALFVLLAAVLGVTSGEFAFIARTEAASVTKVQLTEDEWVQRLSPEAYSVLRKGGTEMAFTSKLNYEKRPGTFACAACGHELFDASTKYNSGTGWPSFFDAVPDGIELNSNPLDKYVLLRTEVRCKKCDGHLGHVFDDGPKPTGKRYCMNGVALKFIPSESDSSAKPA